MSIDEGMAFDEILPHIGELADELLRHPDGRVADTAQELLDWVDAFHRDGLGRLVELIRAWRGEIFLEGVARDPVAGTLLAAYGLGEDETIAAEATAAVEAALEELRPYAESHGGSITLAGIEDGVVQVRLLGACDGCPSSAATLSHGVEEAIARHWPGFRRLELVEDEPAPPAGPEPAPVLLQIRGHEHA